MKTFAVILMVCIAGALGAAVENNLMKLKELGKVCTSETGVDQSKVDRLDNGDLDETDPKLSCWTLCMLKKLAIMNEEGKVIEQTILDKNAGEKIPTADLKVIIAKCSSMKGSNSCDTGKETIKCLYDSKIFPTLWL